MERVQFQQEQMLDELKDLVEKKVFTVAETRQVMKQRSSFEATLVRRVAKKSDFLRYASYEMGLEHLRRKRVERLNIPKTPVTVSDFALVRRQFHIFERALKRFKSDVGLWIEYIQVAKKEGAKSLVGRITARALQLHPNVPALYILAASHELDHLSPSTARTLLQRGIRLNSASVEMWVEYVKMELGFVESLRRRWNLLGITGGRSSLRIEAQEKNRFLDVDMSDERINSAGAVEDPDAEMVRLDQEGDNGERARKQILDGVIVKAVMDSAVQALPQIELFESLNELITTYPTLPTLRESLITRLDGLLRSTLPQNPRAITILYTRFLRSTDTASQGSSSGANAKVLRGQALIEGIRRANEMLISIVSETQEELVQKVYAQFTLEWCGQDSVISLDENLKLYVLSSLQALIRRQKSSSPSLLCTHIKLMAEAAQRGAIEPVKALDTARRYTSRIPESASVWLARLTAVKELRQSVDTVDEVWREARRSVSTTDKDLVNVWTWGLSDDIDPSKRLKVYEDLLNESKEDPLIHGIHEQLLLGYVSVLQPTFGSDPDRSAKTLRHIQNRYLCTGKVWQNIFEMEAKGNGEERVLEQLYELWRKEDMVEATISFAEQLLKKGKGQEASRLIVRSKGLVGKNEQEEMETRWVGVMGVN